MKVVWLFPPSEKGGFPNISQYRFYKKMPIRASIIYPYLASLGATLLKNEGYEVKFMDCPTMNLSWLDVYRELKGSDFVVLEGRTPVMPWIWKTCKDIRTSFPYVKIVLYGDHVTWNPEESFPYCDYIVKGGNYDYGVFTLISLLSKKTNVVPRVFGDSKNNIDLDSLPFVDREFVPWNLYYESWKHREKFFWIMSMRGCFYQCVFCAWTKTFWGNKINYRSPRNVAKEYINIYQNYGECEILDDADLFDTKWGLKFSQKLLNMGLTNEIFWAVQTHPNMFWDLQATKLLRKAGLKTVKLGIESLNQKSLNIMKKRTNISRIEKCFEVLKQADIMIHANLVVGWPWESKKDADRTIELIKKLDPNQAQFSLLIPYPFTELHDLAKENNWLLAQPGDWSSYDASRPMLKMEGLTPEEIVQLYKDHWKRFYLNWKYIWNRIKNVRHWEGVKQLWRGFKSIYFGHMRAIK